MPDERPEREENKEATIACSVNVDGNDRMTSDQ